MVTVLTVPGQTVDYIEEARRWRQILGDRYLGDASRWASTSITQFPAGYYSLQGFLVYVDVTTTGTAIFLTRTNDGVTARIGTMMVRPPKDDILESKVGTRQITRSEIFAGDAGAAPSAMELDGDGSINGVPISKIFEDDGKTARRASLAQEAEFVTHIGSAAPVNEINSSLAFPNRNGARLGLVSTGPLRASSNITGWQANNPAVIWVMDDGKSRVFTADRQTQDGVTISFTATGFTVTGISSTDGRFAVLLFPED